jgi:Skp family chaperone for outer membrane proteins
VSWLQVFLTTVLAILVGLHVGQLLGRAEASAGSRPKGVVTMDGREHELEKQRQKEHKNEREQERKKEHKKEHQKKRKEQEQEHAPLDPDLKRMYEDLARAEIEKETKALREQARELREAMAFQQNLQAQATGSGDSMWPNAPTSSAGSAAHTCTHQPSAGYAGYYPWPAYAGHGHNFTPYWTTAPARTQ